MLVKLNQFLLFVLLYQLALQFVQVVCDSHSPSAVCVCSEDESVEVPAPQCRINFTFSGTNLKAHEALTSFALHTLDRVTKLKLSKDVSVVASESVLIHFASLKNALTNHFGGTLG